MRRIKQQLSDEETINVLKSEKRGFLAIIGDNDYPYNFPINYYYTDNKIIFHSAKEGHFPDSIKKHDKASFAVIDKGTKVENEWYYEYKSVIVRGKIKIITDEEEKINLLTQFGNKYFPTKEHTQEVLDKLFKNTQVMELDIGHMTGKQVLEK